MRTQRANVVVAAALAVSCASRGRAPVARGAPPAPAVTEDAGVDAAPPIDPLPALDALAAQAAPDVPAMRVVLRVADATTTATVAADATDGCFRAIVAATGPVRAWFEDAAHAPRGTEQTGAGGLVPPAGPACARKGESLRLVVSGSADVAARAVIFRTP